MRALVLVVVLSITGSTVYAQGREIVFGRNKPPRAGDKCTLKATKQPGICTNAYECEESVNLMKKGYDFIDVCCGPASLMLICCPTKRKPNLFSFIGHESPTTKFSRPDTEPAKCGVLEKRHGFRTRIVGGGGRDADAYVRAYNVLLGMKEDGVVSWRCGGVLVNYKWVLTAAHCFIKDLTMVRLGEYSLWDSGEKNSFDVEDFEIKSVFLHPKYNYPESYHDLALVELPFKLSYARDHIAPVCLPWVPDSSDIRAGQKVILTGWGAQVYAGNLSNVLQEVHLDVYDAEVCRKSYSDLVDYRIKFPRGIDNFHHLCAGDIEGRRFACQGDSGGPIVYKDSHGRYKLFGLVSAGHGCGVPGFPGIYMPIMNPDYLAWIRKVAFSY